MAQSSKELRARIGSVTNIQKITRAMEMVATTKLRRLQTRAEGTRPYADTIKLISTSLASGATLVAPLTEKRDDLKLIAVLVISSDRGLCGPYNANVIKKVTALLDEQEGVEPDLYVLGKKANSHFRRRMAIKNGYKDEIEKMSYRRAREIAEELSTAFLQGGDQGGVDQVWVVYTRFVSTAKQVVTAEQLLPIDPASLTEGEETVEPNENMIYEPSQEALLKLLLPKSLAVRVFASILDSLASEFAARRMAMKAATDAAGDMITDLRRKYNRARQEGITTELLDIVGGAEALK